MFRWKTCVELLSPRAARIQLTEEDDLYRGPSFFFRNRKESCAWQETTTGENAATYVSEHFHITINNREKVPSREYLKVEWQFAGRTGTWQFGDIDNQNLGASFAALDNCSRHIIAEGVHPFDPLLGHDEYRCNTDEFQSAVALQLRNKLGRYPEAKECQQEIAQFVAGKEPVILDGFNESIRNAFERVRRYPPGFLTRDGLAVIHDTSPLWDTNTQWPRKRPGGGFDLTFIIIGDDYLGALAEITRLSGPIPRPPDWTLGVWYSCYREMGDKEFRKVVEDFAVNDLPLNAVVIDCDWHLHGWHGYDWNREFFPKPQEFFNWLHARGIHAVMNDHPGYIPETESRYEQYRQRSGNNAKPLTSETAPHPLHAGCIPVDLMDRQQVESFFDLFHRPITEAGCDLWWIDGAIPHWDGKPGTAWLNELFARFAANMNDLNPVAFSRALGMGCHRTTINFSGDAWVQWEVLGQEVESTVRGACFLMAWQSHDIGGFYSPEFPGNKPPDDLFVRWTQFGALSPIMRFHSDHGVREPWNFSEETLTLCRQALHLRRRLTPLFKQLADEAHESGVAPWRPMFFSFPELEDAYDCWHQTMIGDKLLFAPVIREDGHVTVWFPPGRWQHNQTGRIVKGPCTNQWTAALDEIPLFKRT